MTLTQQWFVCSARSSVQYSLVELSSVGEWTMWKYCGADIVWLRLRQVFACMCEWKVPQKIPNTNIQNNYFDGSDTIYLF